MNIVTLVQNSRLVNTNTTAVAHPQKQEAGKNRNSSVEYQLIRGGEVVFNKLTHAFALKIVKLKRHLLEYKRNREFER